MTETTPGSGDPDSCGELALEIVAGPVTDGVLGLATLASGEVPAWAGEVPAAAHAAVTDVGDDVGEVWLHLLGLAVECGPDAAPTDLIHRVDALTPVDLLRHVVGVHVPAWHDVVDVEVLEAAARGDAEASLVLLSTPRYYAGNARQALPALLRIGPEEAAARIRAALRPWFEDVVARDADEIRRLLAEVDVTPRPDEPPLATVERVTGGVRFEPEDYTDRIVLVPQVTRSGLLLMAQHRSARIIAFDPTRADPSDLAALAEVFAALGEPSRLAMLRSLAAEPGGVSDLARATDLAKSTVHQHLKVLRRAGLVQLAGQAWRYRYEPRTARLREATDALLHHLDTTEDAP